MFTLISLLSLKVSEITVRLPFKLPDHQPPKYTITAYDSTAKWINSNSKIVRILENPKNRYNSSITIEVISEGPYSQAVNLIAQTHSESVEVTVFIDKISTAFITTKARVLYANSSTDMYELVAYDNAGNKFTSLDSYNIDWIFNTTEIQEVPLNESDLLLLSLLPSQILIQGILLGKSPLKAIIENTIETPTVFIHVVEPIYLLPNEKHILPNANVQINLCSKNGVRNSFDIFKCIKRIPVPQNNFVFESKNTTVVTITQSAMAHGKELGDTKIQVIDQVMPLNNNQMAIYVELPYSLFIPDKWIVVGQNPTLNDAEFYNKNKVILSKPDNIEWKLSDEYLEVGTHRVTAEAFGVSSTFIVHTCEPLKFKETPVFIPLHHNGYKVEVKGGSGQFTFRSTNESIVKYTPDGLIAYDLGKATIIVHDEKLNIEAACEVIVEELNETSFFFDRREFLINEEISFSYKGVSRSGKQFTYIANLSVVSNDQSIVKNVNEKLIAMNPGFVNITCQAPGFTDNILIGVFRPVEADSLVLLTTNEPYDLSISNGPLQWPNADKPKKTVICGKKEISLINDSYLLMEDEYQGMCKISIINPKTELNTNPVLDEFNFTVFADKISRLVTVFIDPLSQIHENTEIASRSSDIISNSNRSTIYVQSEHPIIVKVYALGANDKLLGEYKSPGLKIIDQDGNPFRNNTSITKPSTITIIPPSAINISSTKINIVPLYNITTLTPNNSISTYKFAKYASTMQIYNGTGEYYIKSGKNVFINGSTLSILPSEEQERIIVISDKTIPDYAIEILVITEEPSELVIDGPNYCIINETVIFTVHIYSHRLNEILLDSIDLISETPELNRINHSSWSISSSYPRRIEIIIKSNEITGRKSLEVVDQLKFFSDEVIMYVGETYTPKIIGTDDQIIFSSSNDSIANVLRGTLRAVSPGNASITAYSEKYKLIGAAKLNVIVLDVNNLLIEQFPEKPYVGSYIHLIPYFDTSIGIMKPHLVSWYVNGCDNWEKQFDGSLIIHTEESAQLTVTCTAHETVVEKTIYVDHKLAFSTDSSLLLPVGSNYTLKIENDLDVEYSVSYPNCDNNEGIHINSTGYLTVEKTGVYIIFAKYGTQTAATLITASIPSILYLKTEASSVIHPILLDINGQEYSTYNGVNFKFNLTDKTIFTKGSYFSFVIDEPTYITITSYNKYFSIYNTTFLSNNNIFPENPIALKGIKMKFISSAKKPQWSSTNPSVASISQDGIVHTQKIGSTTIYSSESIYTRLVVTDLEDIDIIEREKFEYYQIIPIYHGLNYNTTNIRYPNDLKISCSWNAPYCGKVYSVDPSNLSASYCKVDLFKSRQCPPRILLTATVTSQLSNIDIRKDLHLKYTSDVWGFPSNVKISVSESQPSVLLPLKVKKENVNIIGCSGIYTKFTDLGLNISADFRFFNGSGVVSLEYVNPNSIYNGDRLEIFITKDSKSSISYNPEKSKTMADRLLFIISVISTCVFGFYAAYMLGSSGNLPPLSPYKNQ